MKETYIGDYINNHFNTNIYENKRTNEIVQYRSLFCYMLHKDLNLTLHSIKEHLNSKGKKINHTSVLHNVRLFEKFEKTNPSLNITRVKILCKLDPKFLLLKRIQNIDDKEKIEQITNCINHYE